MSSRPAAVSDSSVAVGAVTTARRPRSPARTGAEATAAATLGGTSGASPSRSRRAVGPFAGPGLPQLGQRGERAAGVRQQQGALVGEGDAPGAVEEPYAQQRFQSAKPLRQRWLGDAHALRGGAEVLLLRQRDKDFHVPFGQQRSP